MTRINVLDKGFIEVVDKMGTDLTIVNSARVSFGKRKEQLEEEDIKLIRYLKKHKHYCYDAETEVFTDKGWVPWPQVTEDHNLAAVRPEGSFSYEKPVRLYKSEYKGDMILTESAHVSSCVTPNHRMWASRRSHPFKPFDFIEADQLVGKAYRVSTTSILNEGTGGSYWEGFFYGFFLGDGFRASKNRICFHLRKGRKHYAIKRCLSELGMSYKTDLRGETYWVDNSDEIFSGKASCKTISEDAFFRSLEYRTGLWDGLMESDGSRKRSTYTYSSTSHKLVQDIIRLGTTLGKYIKEGKPQHTGDPQHATSYRLMVLSKCTSPRLNDVRPVKHDKVINYEGMIYCAEVSTGLLLVRRKGCVQVSGNSPFRNVQAQFHIKAPEFVMRQWWKHTIGCNWVAPNNSQGWNEISRRYVEIDDFYYPDVWRLQSASNKQASQLDNEGNPVINVHIQQYASEQYDNCITIINRTIKDLIAIGVAKEQAQMLFPISFYTEVYWTASFQAIMNLIELRDDNHAQWETRQYAIALRELMHNLFPIATEAWFSV